MCKVLGLSEFRGSTMNFLSAMLSACVLLLTPNIGAAAVGKVVGSGSVSVNGAAVYEIPLRVPPGPHGIQPELSLTYNSQQGDGILGPGWALSGLSAITRCNRTVAQDGPPAAVTMTYNDAFCLDGKRLRMTSGTIANYGQPGTTYDTEIASFSQITAIGTAGNGPASFIAKAKSGLIYEFGATTDSRVVPDTTNGSVYIWMLNRVSDRSGTSYAVSYGTAGTVRLPTRISYAPTSPGANTYTHTISFSYRPRAASSPEMKGYIEGVAMVNPSLLSTISMSLNGTPSRRYRLTYDVGAVTNRARLTEVTECSGSATDCLSPTKITYQEGAAGVMPGTVSIATGNLTYIGAPDLNGDGRSDVVYADNSGVTVYASLSTNSGLGSPIAIGSYSGASALIALGDVAGLGRADILVPQSSGYTLYRWNGATFSASAIGIGVVPGAARAALLDMNGDGRDDLIVTTDGNSTSGFLAQIQTYPNTSAGGNTSFGSPFSQTVAPRLLCANDCRIAVLTGSPSAGLKALDFNGDGRKDLALFQRGQNATFLAVTFLLSNGSTFLPVAGRSTSPNVSRLPSFLLWNDDACTDFIDGSEVYVSACDGRILTGVPLGVSVPILGPIDANVDGRTDVVVRRSDGSLAALNSTESDNKLLISMGVPAPAGATLKEIFAFDFDGDGQQDVGVSDTSGLSYYIRNAVGAPPDLVASITDGFGIAFSPTYVSLARDNYTKGTGAVYPERDYIAPMYVVSSLAQSTGISSPATFTQDFEYSRARLNVRGRGFLGFGARLIRDSRNGLYTYEYFNHSFPFTGMLQQVDVVQPNNTTLISRTENTFANYTYGSAPETRVLPYVSKASKQSYEVGGSYNGVLVVSTVTTNIVDSASGTVYDSTTVVTEGTGANGLNPGATHTFRTSIASLFNDFSNWCLGRSNSTQQVNTHSLYSGAVRTRTTDTTWDGPNCRPSQRVIEPGNSAEQVTFDLAYDAFGNLTSESVTPVDAPTRVTSIDWGQDGIVPRLLTNPLSQSTTLEWRLDLGVVSRAMDPNGLVTLKTHDNFGRLIREVSPDATSTMVEYLPCDVDCSGFANTRFKVRTTLRDTANGTIAQGFTLFDNLGRVRRSASYAFEGGLIGQSIEYDALGRVLRTSIPQFSGMGVPVWTTARYDLLGRQREATRDRTNDVDTSALTLTMQFEGLTASSTDALGKISVVTLDGIGQVIRSIRASGTADQTQVTYDYDAFRNPTRSTDNAGNEATATYNTLGLQLTTKAPGLGTRTYTYNALGELVSQTDARSQLTTFTYDKLSRPVTRVEPADSGSGTQTTIWIWGNSASSFNIGQLESVSLGVYSESYMYDSFARPIATSVAIDGSTYVVGRSYSPTTGLLESITYPTSTGSAPFKIAYEYDTTNKSGLLKLVKDASTNGVFWQASSSTAFGQYQDVILGNGLRTLTQFDSITGVVNSIETGPRGGDERQHLLYSWDKAGNLSSRQDININKTETFRYDNLYRLTEAAVSGATALRISYDGLGNITSKSDVGSYAYDPARPHAVTSAGSHAFTYDDNGNVITRDGASIDWTAYNLPKLINKNGGNNSQFRYGHDRQRYKHVAVGSAGAETTLYITGLFEKLTRGSTIEYKHSILGPEGVVALHIRRSTGTSETIYPLKDHLGSNDVITSDTGTVLAKLSYDPFGARRDANTWSGAPSASDLQAISNTTRRGFTEHEHLDNLNLIHMNGRVYDPIVARFLSADPFVQAPLNSQSLNRYSYVLNNPLRFTDPSGFACAERVFLPTRLDASGGGGGDTGGCNDNEGLSFLSPLFGGGGGLSGFGGTTIGPQPRPEFFPQPLPAPPAPPQPVPTPDAPQPVPTPNAPQPVPTPDIPTMRPPATGPGGGGTAAPVAGLQPSTGQQSRAPLPFFVAPVAEIAPATGVGAATTAVTVLAPAFFLTGDTESNPGPYFYATYTRFNPITFQVYSGRTSGEGNPVDLVRIRGLQQTQLNAEGFLAPVLDKYASDDPRVSGTIFSFGAYFSIRGREQQLIDFYGGAQSVGGTARNKINGVNDFNPLRPLYIDASVERFGPLPDNSPPRQRFGN